MPGAPLKSLTVNGEPTSAGAVSVDDLLKARGLGDAFVAVAVNGSCVRRRDFAATPLADGDEVEILAPMAGG